MRIALAAHGRFHAFDVARELSRLDHDVCLVTNYPRRVVESWGVPGGVVRPFPLHGAAVRAIARVAPLSAAASCERALHEWFGRRVARSLKREAWDAVVCWSGIGEELFSAGSGGALRVCHRSSAHIRVQDRLLGEESERARLAVERPSPWMIAREEREYALADIILVPSTFAADTFVEMGTPREKLRVVPLGVDAAMFRPSARQAEDRRQRILSGAPLHVAYVGALSVQKGLLDFVEVAKALAGPRFEFHCTGATTTDGAPLVAELARYATVHPPRPQRQLTETYAGADVFLFPTIQDGFGMVVSQALAAGLPVLCSTHCCGPDMVTEGVTGWVVPARRPDHYIERLAWCDAHRAEVAAMTADIHEASRPWTWRDTASGFVTELRSSPHASTPHSILA